MSTDLGSIEVSPESDQISGSPSPVRYVAILAILIFLAELLAMAVLYFVQMPNYVAESLLDGMIMLALILPGLYFLQLKPLLKQVEERTRADQALRSSEELLRRVLELLPVGVWITDKNGKIVHGNPASQSIWAGARYVGIDHYGEYKGWWFDSGERIEPEQWASARAIKNGETTLNEEVMIECFDGTRKIILNSAIPIYLQGAIQGAIIVNQDITRRKQSEQELLHSNELIEKAFNSIDTLIAYMDREFNFIRVNETYARSAGHPVEFLIGKNHFDLYPHEENQVIFQRVVETGEPYSVSEKPFEYAEYPERGVTYWNWSLQPVNGAGGTVQGVVLSLVDVTERKRAQIQLARQNQELLELSNAERRQRELAESLAQATIMLNTSLDLNQVLCSILEQIRKTISFQGANIVLLEGKTLLVAGFLGFEDYPEGVPATGKSYLLDDHPLLQQVCASRQPHRIDSVREHPDWRVVSGMEWVRSYLAVPLQVGVEVIGIINLYHELPGAFTQKEVERLLVFAAPAALALHNARLFEAESTARQAAETLSAAAIALARTLDLDQVLRTLMEHINNIISSDISGVGLLDEEERLAVRVAHGYPRWTGPDHIFSIPVESELDTLFYNLISTRKSQLVTDTATEPLLVNQPEVEHIRNWLLVPIIAHEKAIGLVGLGKIEPGYFTQIHIQWVEALASQAAVAIQNAWLFQQVRSSSERLQSLARKLVEIQENERYYIARELHDEAGQALSLLKLSLGRLEQDPECPQHVRQRLQDLKDVADGVLEGLHRLAVDLRPIALDHLGLVVALQQYAKNLNSDRLSVQFKAVGFEADRLPKDVEISLYRIVQEALTNVVRHAQASNVGILLERGEGRVKVFVEDDGIGFTYDLPENRNRLGLVGMRERAEMFGGTLTIESFPGRGTSVVVEVPDVNSYSYRG